MEHVKEIVQRHYLRVMGRLTEEKLESLMGELHQKARTENDERFPNERHLREDREMLRHDDFWRFVDGDAGRMW